MDATIVINNRKIAAGEPAYIIAEISANHGQNIEEAIRLIHAAADVGADAVKLQTYTPETITLDCDNEYFHIGKGTLWEGKTLFNLYQEAYTPWEWQPQLQQIARSLGLDFFSTPFDSTAVDFLEQMDVPAYKIASFEVVDIPLIRRVAQTGKPVIMSTGMASLAEIEEAVQTVRASGSAGLVLLKCTSAYPAPPEEMNLKTIPEMADLFSVPVGLSDHTLGIEVPIAAVSLGACIIEKHITLSRSVPGPDSAFSLEPQEFKAMVNVVRHTEKALGSIQFGPTEAEKHSAVFRKSLFVVRELKAGDVLTHDNVRVIRPAYGLHPRHLDDVLGKQATRDIQKGTPLSWDLVGENP